MERAGAVLVVVDANIIVMNALLRGDKWDAAREAINAGRLRVVLPATARLEAIGTHRRAHETKVLELKKILRRSSDRAKQAADSLLAVYEQEIADYETLLDARILDIGIEIANEPSHSHIEITERAIARKPPFDERGGGYRDTLLWLTAIEQLDEPPFEHLVLVSDDAIFTKQAKSLASELHDEAQAELLVPRRIELIDFPGEYEVGDFTLSDTEVEESQIVSAIGSRLRGLDVSRWSPLGVDHALVHVVGGVELLGVSIEVKKRYGTEIFDLQTEAIADIDAQLLIIQDVDGDDVDFSEVAARWDLQLRWRGKTVGNRRRLSDDDMLEVLGVTERRPSTVLNPADGAPRE